MARDSLLIADLVALADKAFFVFFPHVGVQFVVAEEALATESAHGMDTALWQLLRRSLSRPLVLHH